MFGGMTPMETGTLIVFIFMLCFAIGSAACFIVPRFRDAAIRNVAADSSDVRLADLQARVSAADAEVERLYAEVRRAEVAREEPGVARDGQQDARRASQVPPRDFYEIISTHPQLWSSIRREAKTRALENARLLAGETGTV